MRKSIIFLPLKRARNVAIELTSCPGLVACPKPSVACDTCPFSEENTAKLEKLEKRAEAKSIRSRFATRAKAQVAAFMQRLVRRNSEKQFFELLREMTKSVPQVKTRHRDSCDVLFGLYETTTMSRGAHATAELRGPRRIRF